MDKRKIGEVLLILGTIMFVGGAIGYITRQLPIEQISGIGALALILVVTGVSMKKTKQRTGEKNMKKYMNDKTEGIIAIVAAFFVLLSAMISPLVSAVIAIGTLSCIGIWKISNK